MCEQCYIDYGAPTKFTPAVLNIAAELKSADHLGGLHIVVDDWNLEDESIEYCAASDEASEAEKALAARLRLLDIDERATALALADGFIQEPATPPAS